jgi:hypothetical protein
LCGEDHIEGEAGDESVEDELVVDFLEGGEDARERSGEVVEDLEETITISIRRERAYCANIDLPRMRSAVRFLLRARWYRSGAPC